MHALPSWGTAGVNRESEENISEKRETGQDEIFFGGRRDFGRSFANAIATEGRPRATGEQYVRVSGPASALFLLARRCLIRWLRRVPSFLHGRMRSLG